MSEAKPSPEELRQLEHEHADEVAHKIQERKNAIEALEADVRRLQDAETLHSGEARQARQKYNAEVSAMDDKTFDQHVADLDHQARKEAVERSGVRLTLGQPDD